MSFIIGQKHIPEEGTQIGTLVTIVDLGVQERGDFKGEKLAPAPIVFLTFELPNDHVGGDSERPAHVHKEVLQSKNNQSTFYAIASALRGGGSTVEKEFTSGIDVGKLIGKSALLQIGKTSTGNAKVVSVSPLMKGTTVPEPKAPLIMYSIHNPDEEVYELLPQFVRTKIERGRLLAKGISSEDREEDEFSI